jgi:hypothetical protein
MERMAFKGFRFNKWLPLVGLFFLCLFAQSGFAGEASTIELRDGSIISGEVLTFDGSTWIIQSPSMGRLEIEAGKVVSIRSRATGGKGSAGEGSTGKEVRAADIQAMQQSIMSNEQLMTMIMGLQDDPELQAILQDPEIMKAVEAGDINALLADPKFRKLMENRNIKAITREALKE